MGDRSETARPSLDRSMLGGIAWTGGVKWATQLLTWLTTLLVARILSPEDYGLIGMAGIFLGLITALTEFGIGAAVLNLRQLSDRQINALNTFAVLIGAGFCLLSISMSKPIGVFFNSPRLPSVVVFMSFAFVINGFRTVPYGLLLRDLRFKDIALMEGVKAVVVSLGVLTLAMLGFGYWALAANGVLEACCLTALMVYARGRGFGWPRLTPVKEAMSFSLHLVVGRLAWYIYSNADFLMAGRVLGEAALGAYTLAWTFSSMPVEQITSLVGRVSPSIFAAVQEDEAAMRRYLLRLTEGIAFLAFPFAFGMSLVASPFVRAVLGEKWVPAVPLIQTLAAYSAVRSLLPLLSQVLIARGKTRFTMSMSLITATAMTLAFWVGSRFGTAGIALAWPIMHPAVSMPLFLKVSREIEMRPLDYLRAVWGPLRNSLLMVVVVVAVIRLLPGDWPEWVRLIAPVISGVVVFSGMTFFFDRHRIFSFIRLARGREPGPGAG